MKRTYLAPHASAFACAFAAAILAGALFGSAPARADISVHIDIGNAPPPPSIVFRVRPHEQIYPGERVYVVDDPGVGDNDCFRYGGYYWVFRDGYWYRSPSWRSRFRVVHPRYVPSVFYRMPPARWKHRPVGPPGLMKKEGGMPPGQLKKQGGGPPGQTKKGEKDRGKPGGGSPHQ
jgi:hypothetical protein